MVSSFLIKPLTITTARPRFPSWFLELYRLPVYDKSMIKSFRCADTEALFMARRVARFVNIETVARRRLKMPDAAHRLGDLRSPPGNGLEALARDRAGQHSIRINDQWRLCFRWDGGAVDVEILDYH